MLETHVLMFSSIVFANFGRSQLLYLELVLKAFCLKTDHLITKMG